MKKVILFFAGLFITFTAFSQDLIVKNNWEKIHCHVVSEDSVYVYYTYWQDDTYEIKTLINKQDIKQVIYNAQYRKTLARDSLNKMRAARTAKKTVCLTGGILEGGGSILGLDLEIPLGKIVSLQFGGGFLGFGYGIDVHIRRTMRSSFFSLQYWHQGIGDSYTQSLLGPAYVFRGKRWFTAQIGIAYALTKGPALPLDYKQAPVMLTYALGFYLPL